MRKSEVLNFHLCRLRDASGSVSPDIQFTIADRVTRRMNEYVSLLEEGSLVALFDVLIQEVSAATREFNSF